MSGPRYRTVPFRDELLADRSVRRAYADGRQEWRQRTGDGTVTWRDDRGRTGTDEPLGRRIVKRTVHPGTPHPGTSHPGAVSYGRNVGYGRTAWSDGVMTVNETSLGGRTAAVLAAVGAAGLLPAVLDPPAQLSPEEEEQLRAQAQQGGDVSVSDGDGWYDDSGGFDDAGDFG